MNELLKNIYQAIIEGDLAAARTEVRAAMGAGIAGGEVLNSALISAMGEVGCRFEKEEYFAPEMLVAARAMQARLEILRPALVQSGLKPLGKIAIGTVKGDLHDIGKNLVAMMLGGAGFEILDLGVDVAREKFLEAAPSGVNMTGLSALLTTTMRSMETVIHAIEAAGLRDRVKIAIAGAPVTAEFARQTGADGFAPYASQAGVVATTLISQ